MISHYPELENTLTIADCELSATVYELSELVNIESFEENGLVLLYFDVARDKDGDPRGYRNRLDRLSEFKRIFK